MKKTFTKAEIMFYRGCYTPNQVLALSFIENKKITLDDVLNSEITLSDKIHFMQFNCGCLAYDEFKQMIFEIFEWLVCLDYIIKPKGKHRFGLHDYLKENRLKKEDCNYIMDKLKTYANKFPNE